MHNDLPYGSTQEYFAARRLNPKLDDDRAEISEQGVACVWCGKLEYDEYNIDFDDMKAVCGGCLSHGATFTEPPMDGACIWCGTPTDNKLISASGAELFYCEECVKVFKGV